ncbi:medium-chain fatty acid-CoA ligase faa2 [Linderina pennispora]|nr:medium-chain fatty acid-CoA ligase faa2 [Linderina pennispora]
MPGLHSKPIAKARVFGYRKNSAQGADSEFSWISFGEFHDRFRCLARGLAGLGMRRGDNIGIFSGNRLEWLIAEFATYYHGYVSVAIYETLGQLSCEYVLNLTELTTVFCSSECAQKLLKMRDQIPLLKKVILMDPPVQELVDRLTDKGFAVYDMCDVERYGREYPDIESPPKPGYDEVATIVFSSGTTGQPKGAVLTHGNIVSICAGVNFVMDQRDLPYIGPNDCAVSIIPLSHVQGRSLMHMIIALGAKTAFTRNDPRCLLSDLRQLKPTIFFGVPKFFNRVQDKVMSSVKERGNMMNSIFKHAMRAKLRNMKQGQKGHWLWDQVIFKPISETLGGNIRLVVSGTSSISREALDFIRCIFSCDVVEGYGLTETTGASCMTVSKDNISGHVGSPFPTSMIKLVSVKELGYKVDDKPFPRGEIYVKGANVFRGYYRQPELTAQVLSPDGWLRTGDLGTFDALGRMRVLDRIVNIFTLKTGESIEPERLEYVYCDNGLVSQAFVYGSSDHDRLVGIAVPDKEFMEVFLLNNKLIPEGSRISHELICADENIRNAVRNEINRHGIARGLRTHELISSLFLEPHSFDYYDLLTPSMKLKRYEALRHYRSCVNRLYQDIGDQGSVMCSPDGKSDRSYSFY